MATDATVGLRSGRSRFYVWMAAACVLIAFGLFAPTYWLQIPPGQFTGSPLLHLHGLLFSAWTLLFLSQTLLAANGRIETHRAWGMLGIALATAMLFSGMATGILSMKAGIAAGNGANARAFAIVPISAIVIFAALVAFAIARVRRPETHKRLMLLATLSIMQAPLDRIFFAMQVGMGPDIRPGTAPTPPPEATLPSGLLTFLLILVAAGYDWRTRGRPHAVYVVGGGLVVAATFLRVPLGSSSAWLATADFLARFAG